MNRRKFISAMAGTIAAGPVTRLLSAGTVAQARPVQVVVWDEQQPEQKQAYENFLGNAIADHLKSKPGFAVRSVAFSDPEQGLADDVLNNADVLVYWSHFRTNPAVTPANAGKVVDRIKAGKLSMITLHSAH